MRKPTTTYFDTSFFVWLAKATETEFEDAISQLNQHKIRYVLSGYILLELLSGLGRHKQDERLVERVQRFTVQPLNIPFGVVVDSSGDLSWNSLLMPDAERSAFAQQLKDIFDQETVARSFSNLADTNLNADNRELLEKAIEPFHRSIGFDKATTDSEKVEAYLNFTAGLLSELADVLPPEMRARLSQLQFGPVEGPADALRLSQQLLNVLGENIVEKIGEESRLMNSSVALDPRPLDVAVERVPKKSLKQLGNTFRDAGHMSIFVFNRNDIDFLQVDRRQLELITRSKPIHRIKELGLQSRCFAAGNLQKAVEQVIRMSVQ